MVLVRGAWEVYRSGTDRFEWRHSRMSAQIRQPRTRGGGGRTLMLLGVILALAAGIMVIYVVSTAGGPQTHEVTVVEPSALSRRRARPRSVAEARIWAVLGALRPGAPGRRAYQFSSSTTKIPRLRATPCGP
jgi:hypothetical protein